MIRLTLTTSLPLAILMMCGGPSRVQADDTKVTVKDGGSILLRADGLDAGTYWNLSPAELRHQNTAGVLRGLRIIDGGADQCAGDPKCGIDLTQPWTIQVTYGAGSVTIAPISGNQGLHLTNTGLPFDQWQSTANADERVYGHGDGLHITSITLNSGAASLCSGSGGCEITLFYRPQ
ncbi:MAG: hypothetical protein ABSG56_19575 [Bryobacteraceae bacterium]|jgi:hypothetical protein